MTEAAFEFNVSVPCDSRFTVMLRQLAAHAARNAGCDGAAAEAFGEAVETAVQKVVRECPTDAGPAARDLQVVVRGGSGPVEVVVDGHAFTLNR